MTKLVDCVSRLQVGKQILKKPTAEDVATNLHLRRKFPNLNLNVNDAKAQKTNTWLDKKGQRFSFANEVINVPAQPMQVKDVSPEYLKQFAISK